MKKIFISFLAISLFLPNATFALGCMSRGEKITNYTNLVLIILFFVVAIVLVIALLVYIVSKIRKKRIRGKKLIKWGLVIIFIIIIFSLAAPRTIYKYIESKYDTYEECNDLRLPESLEENWNN